MTTYNRTSLKTFFESGDVPTGTDYANLIDSCLNIVETGVQTIAGPINPTEVITPRVSAANGNFTTGLTTVAMTISGITSAAAINCTTVSAATGTFDTAIATIVSAGTVYSTNGLISSVGIVSAAGTTQGTAASLTNIINRGKGVADGTTTGFTPLHNKAGLVQYLFNEGVSANLWPPTGGFINGLAVNAAFPLAASAMVTIVHLTASAMAVK